MAADGAAALRARLEALLGGDAEACAAAAFEAAEAIRRSLASGGTLLIFGNGGSAADAQHVAAELVGRFARERAGLPAIALTTDASALTAIANDFGFERVFARQVEALGRRGDVALAISTSGSSPNVIAAARTARERGLLVVGLAGAGGGALAREADILVCVPDAVTARIQECHLVIEHAICDHLDAAAAEADPAAPAQPGAVTWEALDALRDRWRRQGRTVVWTSGCFDLLHVGHLHSLEAARALGDVLVVGINGDASVQRLKGPGRPILSAAHRAELLAALEPVDHVVVFDEDTPEVALGRLQPDIHCKGAEYAPPDGRPIPERAVVEGYGGRVEFLPLTDGESTSALLDRIARAGER